MGRRPHHRGLLVALAVALAAAGCGTRVHTEDSQPDHREAAPAVGQVGGPSSISGYPGASTSPSTPRPPTAASPDATPVAPVASRRSGGPRSSSPVPRGPADAPSRAAAEAAPSSPSGDVTPTPRPDPLPAGPLEPIVIGSVGTLSGPVGAAMRGGPVAVQVWAQAVNAAGGLDGHPVEVVVADDGGDPARYQAAVRDLVERREVLAFVSNMAAFTLSAARAYLEDRRVPVIGGDLTSGMWHTSPMFFPQSGGEQAMIWGMVANAAETGQVRFGSLVCHESQGCQAAERYWYDEGWVEQAGMEPAYRAQVSIVQPDYTAECLAARQARTEVLAVVADPATVRRVARSCSRQGYHPRYSIAGPAVEDGIAQDPTGALDGALGSVVAFPYVVDDTEATAEFHRAVRRFAPGEPLTSAMTQGWVSAKLFERAAAGLGPELDRESLLDRLWRLSGDTLGGLTAPRSFVREGPNPDLACFFSMQVAAAAWTAPSGTRIRCRPGSPGRR